MGVLSPVFPTGLHPKGNVGIYSLKYCIKNLTWESRIANASGQCVGNHCRRKCKWVQPLLWRTIWQLSSNSTVNIFVVSPCLGIDSGGNTDIYKQRSTYTLYYAYNSKLLMIQTPPKCSAIEICLNKL